MIIGYDHLKRRGTQGTLTEQGPHIIMCPVFRYKYCEKLSTQRLAPNNGSCVSLLLKREGAHNQPHLKSWFIEELF